MTHQGELYYFNKDHLGSVKELIRHSDDQVIQEYHYSTYGQTSVHPQNNNQEVSNSRAFTAREYEKELNLYYYRARYYDPSTGRFLSPDPIGFNGGDTNLYRYVLNNPLRYVDPFGLKNINLTGHPLPDNYYVNQLERSSVDVVYYDDPSLNSRTLGETLRGRDYSAYRPGDAINVAINPNQSALERNITVTHEAVHAYGIATTGGLQSGLSGYDHLVLTPQNDLNQYIQESRRNSCGP